jgi:hypothetical protein
MSSFVDRLFVRLAQGKTIGVGPRNVPVPVLTWRELWRIR